MGGAGHEGSAADAGPGAGAPECVPASEKAETPAKEQGCAQAKEEVTVGEENMNVGEAPKPKFPNRIGIMSDGTSTGTELFDADTGALLDLPVTAVQWQLTCPDIGKAVLYVSAPVVVLKASEYRVKWTGFSALCGIWIAQIRGDLRKLWKRMTGDKT